MFYPARLPLQGASAVSVTAMTDHVSSIAARDRAVATLSLRRLPHGEGSLAGGLPILDEPTLLIPA